MYFWYQQGNQTLGLYFQWRCWDTNQSDLVQALKHLVQVRKTLVGVGRLLLQRWLWFLPFFFDRQNKCWHCALCTNQGLQFSFLQLSFTKGWKHPQVSSKWSAAWLDLQLAALFVITGITAAFSVTLFIILLSILVGKWHVWLYHVSWSARCAETSFWLHVDIF